MFHFPRAFLLTAIFVSSFAAHSAIVPFSESFDSYGAGDVAVGEFIESNPSVYTIVEDDLLGDYNYRSATSTTSGTLSASAAVLFLESPGINFTVSTRFRINSTSISPGTARLEFGFGALGTDPDFSTGFRYSIMFALYGAGGADQGLINIYEDGTKLTTQVRGARLIYAPNVDFSLTLTGTYASGSLQFSATAMRLDTLASTTTTATDPAPQSGQYFGYLTEVISTPGYTSAQNVEYDNFYVVPEPGAALLSCAGTTAMAFFRRRGR